jgi:hypothetical protein
MLTAIRQWFFNLFFTGFYDFLQILHYYLALNGLGCFEKRFGTVDAIGAGHGARHLNRTPIIANTVAAFGRKPPSKI